jgi:hypothetical protein
MEAASCLLASKKFDLVVKFDAVGCHAVWSNCILAGPNRTSPTAMDGEYDIFKKSSAKDAIWVETVQGFEQAKRRLLHYTSI